MSLTKRMLAVSYFSTWVYTINCYVGQKKAPLPFWCTVRPSAVKPSVEEPFQNTREAPWLYDLLGLLLCAAGPTGTVLPSTFPCIFIFVCIHIYDQLAQQYLCAYFVYGRTACWPPLSLQSPPMLPLLLRFPFVSYVLISWIPPWLSLLTPTRVVHYTAGG